MSIDHSQRLTGVRGLVARRMQQSLQQAAQLTFHARLDATSLLAQTGEYDSVKVSVEDLVAYRLVAELTDHARFNATIVENEVTQHAEVNLGVAVEAGGHLMVPVIRGAQALSLSSLAGARRELVALALDNQLKPDHMRHGTATLSNLGRGRTEQFTPILNPGQVALLGMASLQPAPWVDEDVLAIRPVLHLSLTVDHRWIDGAPANRFLTSICEHLESES